MFFKIALAALLGVGMTMIGFSFVIPQKVVDKEKHSIVKQENKKEEAEPSETTKTVKNVKHKRLTLSLRRTVFIFGEIHSGMVDPVANTINNLGAEESDEPIVVIIDSPGGSVIDGAKIVTAIQESRAPVFTVCVRLCASMAAVIHAYGTTRMAVNRSILMYHNASGGAQGDLERMLSLLTTIKNYITKFDRDIAARSTLSYNRFKALATNELWLDAEDATKLRLNDEIVVINNPPLSLSMPGMDEKTKPVPGSKPGSKPMVIEPNKTRFEIVL